MRVVKSMIRCLKSVSKMILTAKVLFLTLGYVISNVYGVCDEVTFYIFF